jgi:hypothetical protein
VYVLDSDEDNSRDIPIKKPEIASNNNNFYSHNLSQKENFYNTDRLEESQSKNMTMSDNADNFFRGNNNSSSVHNSNSNFLLTKWENIRFSISDRLCENGMTDRLLICCGRVAFRFLCLGCKSETIGICETDWCGWDSVDFCKFGINLEWTCIWNWKKKISVNKSWI